MEGTREPRFGIDIGNVIIDGPAHPAGGNTAFFEGDEATLLATPAASGMFESVASLVERFEGRVWLVSKCGARVQERSMRWLHGNEFFSPE